MNKKKRLFYERPQQEVVALEVTAPLLDNSGEGGTGNRPGGKFSPAYYDDLGSDDE